MSKKKGQNRAPDAPKAEAEAPKAEAEVVAPDAPKADAIERDGNTLIADHTHAGTDYPAGTKLDAIEGLTPNNVAFLVQHNKV